MAQTIWELIVVVVALFAGWRFVCFLIGSGFAIFGIIAASLIFRGALVVGFIGFMFTHGSVDALLIGAVIGGIIGGLIHHGAGTLLKIILWTIIGVGVGYVFGMMILFGIIGFFIGLIRC